MSSLIRQNRMQCGVLSDTLEAKWIIEAVTKAQRAREISKPLIIHTDRGSQYVSGDYINVTADMQRSYSKKAYPWDNACIEAFHALIKREWLNRFKIFDYNTVRIHSHCGYLSPNEYEDRYRKELKNLELIAG